ncbi:MULTISPECIES: hypothetical protein [Aeromonas]|uniref:hypothetical protein n=1 Tax=Aeromonas TaxID=642 RepID=UPI003BA3269C
MKKVDALYCLLLEELHQLCENVEQMEAYWNLLGDEDKNLFDDLTEKLSKEKRELAKCKRELSIYDDYDLLKQLISDFHDKFQTYPGLNSFKMDYIITISENIFHNSSVIPDENVALELWHTETQQNFNISAYISNVLDIEKTVAWFSPSSKESVNELVNTNTNIECWYSLLMAAASIDFINSQQLLFYSKRHHDNGVTKENILALLKIHMASSGLEIIPSPIYSKKPSNSSLNLYCPSQKYLQFMDVIGILGEYNNRGDVLSKYLSIFHVIENFMFKEPIVSLERSTPGSMFSIRDFKRLYKSVDVDESRALNKLFKRVFNMQFGNNTFKVYSHQLWVDFLTHNHANQGEIDNFLRSLTIKDMNAITEGSFCDFISRVTYQTRCSIVHNKETELHISSQNYPLGCKLILEEFLLVFLEEMIFLLISTENDIVWYSSNTVRLWA